MTPIAGRVLPDSDIVNNDHLSGLVPEPCGHASDVNFGFAFINATNMSARTAATLFHQESPNWRNE